MPKTARIHTGANRLAPRYEQIVIERVRPSLEGGHPPIKGIVGDIVTVEASVFRHGHDRVRATLWWQPPDGDAGARETPMMLVNPGLDLWRGELPLDTLGRYRYTVTGWTDVHASWLDELAKRVKAAQ